eukprot:CAMPEP_0171451830 /NCGR_PEP_ID=MMETSP0945-20130129/176_1 /TAXON_ID=109269 /ORGANISM="Vaucheria litorea, Strain CCMP2940" /LENGTH=182 /DNA_ID=CAMNT_0011976365 /DNA_START=143 /DNA_END=688 /DNA_ORIENTATION=-
MLSKIHLLLAALNLFLFKGFSFIVDVGSGEWECFMLPAPAHSTIAGNFELLTEGVKLDPISIIVRDVRDLKSLPKFESSNEGEGTFEFDVIDDGDFEMCIGNGGDVATDGMMRTFGFAFRLEGIVDDGLERTDHSKINEMLDAGGEFVEDLYNMVDHQSYMRQREGIHRITIESTNTRVVMW